MQAPIEAICISWAGACLHARAQEGLIHCMQSGTTWQLLLVSRSELSYMVVMRHQPSLEVPKPMVALWPCTKLYPQSQIRISWRHSGTKSNPNGFTRAERRDEREVRGESGSISHHTSWTQHCYLQGPARGRGKAEVGATLTLPCSSSTRS